MIAEVMSESAALAFEQDDLFVHLSNLATRFPVPKHSQQPGWVITAVTNPSAHENHAALQVQACYFMR
jgi:hypothetical protein